MRRVIRRQRTIVARLARDIERKARAAGMALSSALHEALAKARRIVAQTAQQRTADGTPKLYSWHAPEVECINFGFAPASPTSSA